MKYNQRHDRQTTAQQARADGLHYRRPSEADGGLVDHGMAQGAGSDGDSLSVRGGDEAHSEKPQPQKARKESRISKRSLVIDRLLSTSQSYCQIANEFGVTRQRVGAIAKTISLDGLDRWHRKIDQAARESILNFDPTRLTEAARLAWAHARARGLRVEPYISPTKDHSLRRKSIVVATRRMPVVDLRTTHQYYFVKWSHRFTGAPFVLIVCGLKTVYVVPADVLRDAGGAYIRRVPRRNKKVGAKPRVDWSQYKEAWSLIALPDESKEEAL